MAVTTKSDGRVSPNGRWLAYVSTANGRSEVYVRELTGGNDRYKMISTGGGASPRWRRDGRELFYIATASTVPVPFGANVPDGRLMAVEVKNAAERFPFGIPERLFQLRATDSQYHPARDGRRFLINTGGGVSALPITVTVNWPSALKRSVLGSYASNSQAWQGPTARSRFDDQEGLNCLHCASVLAC